MLSVCTYLKRNVLQQILCTLIRKRGCTFIRIIIHNTSSFLKVLQWCERWVFASNISMLLEIPCVEVKYHIAVIQCKAHLNGTHVQWLHLVFFLKGNNLKLLKQIKTLYLFCYLFFWQTLWNYLYLEGYKMLGAEMQYHHPPCPVNRHACKNIVFVLEEAWTP